MKRLVNWWLICGWLAVASSVFAASQTDSLTVGYSSFAGAYGPLWISVEEQLGRKHGLELKAIYAGRIRPHQLLASGEVSYVVATETGALSSHILGVKDQAIILTFINKVDSGIFSKAEIKSPEELRGKTIATGRPGAFADTMVRYVLRAKLGLVPDRDVKLLPMGEAALTFPALEKGIVEAASLTMPFNLLAKKMGFRELVNYDRAGVVYGLSLQYRHDFKTDASEKSRVNGQAIKKSERRHPCLQNQQAKNNRGSEKIHARCRR